MCNNFALAAGTVKRAILIQVDDDNVRPPRPKRHRAAKFTVMALVERQPGCVRVAQVRADTGDDVLQRFVELEKTGIVSDLAASSEQSYFSIKLTENFSQETSAATTDGDQKLLERALGVKSLPIVGFYTFSLIGQDYLQKSSTTIPVARRQWPANKVFTIIRLSKNGSVE